MVAKFLLDSANQNKFWDFLEKHCDWTVLFDDESGDYYLEQTFKDRALYLYKNCAGYRVVCEDEDNCFFAFTVNYKEYTTLFLKLDYYYQKALREEAELQKEAFDDFLENAVKGV